MKFQVNKILYLVLASFAGSALALAQTEIFLTQAVENQSICWKVSDRQTGVSSVCYEFPDGQKPLQISDLDGAPLIDIRLDGKEIPIQLISHQTSEPVIQMKPTVQRVGKVMKMFFTIYDGASNPIGKIKNLEADQFGKTIAYTYSDLQNQPLAKLTRLKSRNNSDEQWRISLGPSSQSRDFLVLLSFFAVQDLANRPVPSFIQSNWGKILGGTVVVGGVTYLAYRSFFQTPESAAGTIPKIKATLPTEKPTPGTYKVFMKAGAESIQEHDQAQPSGENWLKPEQIYLGSPHPHINIKHAYLDTSRKILRLVFATSNAVALQHEFRLVTHSVKTGFQGMQNPSILTLILHYKAVGNISFEELSQFPKHTQQIIELDLNSYNRGNFKELEVILAHPTPPGQNAHGLASTWDIRFDRF